MSTEEINSKLEKLYSDYYKRLIERKLEYEGDPSCPLFLKAFPAYTAAKNKILIIGKETNSWVGSMKDEHSLARILEEYDEFSLGHGYRGKSGKEPKRTLNSPFWNFSRSIYTALNPDANRKDLGFLWSNVSRMDSGAEYRVMPSENRKKEDFQLLADEIEILKPDTVIFLAGNDYNEEIEKHIGLKWTTKNERLQIHKPEIRVTGLPENTYKVYHPRYLSTRKIYWDVIDELGSYMMAENKLLNELT